MSSDFFTSTHGKWILSGEHAVIRGQGALVFPLLEKSLTLSYQSAPRGPLTFSTDIIDQAQDKLRPLLEKVLRYGMQRIGQSYQDKPGHLHITSTIPVGVGMGASAALCVAITRWFVAQGWIDPTERYTVARDLEHVFHGQSSGLDIAGVKSLSGIYFQNGNITPLKTTWTPHWQLTSCGHQGPTANAIQTVQKLWIDQPQEAKELDLLMQGSVILAKQALEAVNPDDEHLHQLATAINQACECFIRWDLVSPPLQQHMQDLRDQGALAVKPTGSGGGGYVISLWKTKRTVFYVSPVQDN